MIHLGLAFAETDKVASTAMRIQTGGLVEYITGMGGSTLEAKSSPVSALNISAPSNGMP